MRTRNDLNGIFSDFGDVQWGIAVGSPYSSKLVCDGIEPLVAVREVMIMTVTIMRWKRLGSEGL